MDGQKAPGRSALSSFKTHLANRTLDQSREGEAVARAEYGQHLSSLWDKVQPTEGSGISAPKKSS